MTERLVTVTLVRAWEPGERPDAGGRIEFAVALDAGGRPDVQAWLDDPAPWPARREQAGDRSEPGDVAYDEEGWQLRFFNQGSDTDVSPVRIAASAAPMRPGEVLTLRAPDGEEAAWRVVGVSPRG